MINSSISITNQLHYNHEYWIYGVRSRTHGAKLCKFSCLFAPVYHCARKPSPVLPSSPFSDDDDQ